MSTRALSSVKATRKAATALGQHRQRAARQPRAASRRGLRRGQSSWPPRVPVAAAAAARARRSCPRRSRPSCCCASAPESLRGRRPARPIARRWCASAGGRAAQASCSARTPATALVRLRGARRQRLPERRARAARAACGRGARRGRVVAAGAGVRPRARCGGRSWWTTWIVRRITCVRTSATCVPDPPPDLDRCVAGRSASAASAPATSAAAREAIRVLVGRRGIWCLVRRCAEHCAPAALQAPPSPGKALAKLSAGQSSRPCRAELPPARLSSPRAFGARRRARLPGRATAPAGVEPSSPAAGVTLTPGDALVGGLAWRSVSAATLLVGGCVRVRGSSRRRARGRGAAARAPAGGRSVRRRGRCAGS